MKIPDVLHNHSFSDCLVLTGPTGSGKSALALQLAERIGAEILAMDSMTLYRGMDIGTAKPSSEERGRIRHHLIDVLDPHESASVAWWLEQAAAACGPIRARGNVPMFVGGTPLYLKALLEGLFLAPSADSALRATLEAEAAAIGPEAFHARLRVVDPATAARVHPNDTRRIVRALEVHQLTNQPISKLQTTWQSATFSKEAPVRNEIAAVMLDWPRPALHERIDRRVLQMVDAGWLEECRRLLARPLSREARQAVGYAELFEHLEGKLTLASAVERIQARTRQFAKRQCTWFRRLPVIPVPGNATDVEERVMRAWRHSRERKKLSHKANEGL